MIDVVYLAYCNEKIGYGIEIVENFLNSYKSHSAGIEHNFVIIAKNWTNKALYNKLRGLAKEHHAKVIDLPDDGLDFGAYFRVSKILQNEYVFFLGSNIELVSDNWLLYHYRAFESDILVKLAGPMGSYDKGIADAESFPNYHIRTCSFMVNRKLFLEYISTQKFPKTKKDTWKLEHGKQSLTQFVLKRGHKAVVVNSDGEVFTPENWVLGKTYTYPYECKALMTDKWAKRYYKYSKNVKAVLEAIVWGKNFTEFPENFVDEFSSKINIFVSYAKIFDTISTNVFHPIFLLNPHIKIDTKTFLDNIGINIADKNKTYGKLTGYYWIWKNYLPTADTEYIGFCEIQRFLDFNVSKINPSPFRPIFIADFKNVFEEYTEENIFNCIQGYDVILPEKSPTDKVSFSHDIDLLSDIIKEIYPQYIEVAKEVMSSGSMYTFGNFVMRKEIFNEAMEWLFSILTIVEQKTKLCC